MPSTARNRGEPLFLQLCMVFYLLTQVKYIHAEDNLISLCISRVRQPLTLSVRRKSGGGIPRLHQDAI